MDKKIEAQAAAGTVEGDAILVGRVAAGDRHAFEMLYRAYFPRLARFLQRMTRSVPLIEEIVNDTLLVVWQKAATFDGSCKVSTWVFAIAYRQALKALRNADRALPLDEDDALASPLSGPEVVLQQQHLHARVGDALEALPPIHRIVIELAYYNGHSCREIAEVMMTTEPPKIR